MLTFAPNITTMFHEYDFLDRFKQAKDLGFENVELQFPYDYESSQIAAARSGVKCVLINSYCGEVEMGLASIPGREIQFLSELHNMTPYCNAMETRRVHIMAGLLTKGFTFEEQMTYYKDNLNAAVNYLENQDIVGVIEPICPEVKKDYFLSSFEIALDVIKYCNTDHLKLLLDVYHLHKITGNVERYLEEYFPYAGHIQISQDPGRHEPFHPDGKIDYKRVFDFLSSKNYTNPIGLEYFPSGSTAESLEWVKDYK